MRGSLSRVVVIACVCLLHAVALLLVDLAMRTPDQRAFALSTSQRVAARIVIEPMTAQQPNAEPNAAQRSRETRASRRRWPARSKAEQPREAARETSGAHEPGLRRTPEPQAITTAVASPEDAASAPLQALGSAPDTMSLIDTPATKQAIRQVARDSRFAAAQPGIGDPSQSTPMARAIQAAGKGDCLRGDFASPGADGLVRLPFLIAAGLSGQCAK
jgi:hypothetical protein